MPIQDEITVELNDDAVSTDSSSQDLESTGQVAVVPNYLVDQNWRIIFVDDINNGTIDEDYILPETPVEFSRVEDFVCQINRSISEIKKVWSEYIISWTFFSQNNNASNFGNIVQYLLPIDQDSGFPDTTFNCRNGLNNRPASICQTPTGYAMVGAWAFGFTNYQWNIIVGILKIDANGDYDTDTSLFGLWLTSSTSASSMDILGCLSDGALILCGSAAITYNGVTYGRLIKIKTDGTVDSTFNTNIWTWPDASCGVLVNSDDTMYIYGTFQNFNGVSKKRIIKLNADGTVDATFDVGTGFGGTVHRLESNWTNIYAVGAFTTWKGATHNRIVYLDNTWSVVAGRAPVSWASATVYFVSISGTDLYILGDFTTYDGVGAVRVAKIDSATGTIITSFVSTVWLSLLSTTSWRIFSTSTGVIIVPWNFSQASRAGVAIPWGIIKVSPLWASLFTYNGGFDNHQTIYSNRFWSKIFCSNIWVYAGLHNYNWKSIQNCIWVSIEDAKNVTPYYRDRSRTTWNHFYTAAIWWWYFVTKTAGDVRKFYTNWSLDSTFVPPTFVSANNTKILCLSSTVVVVVWSFSTVNWISKQGVVGLDMAGAISSSFNVWVGVSSWWNVYGTILLASWKVLIFGDFTSYNGHTTKNIARINTDWSPDTSFVSTISLLAYRVAEDTDQTLWIWSISSPYTILHLSAVGADLSFPAPVLNNRVEAIMIHKDKIHVWGTFTTVWWSSSQYYAVINKDGTVYHLAGTDFNSTTVFDLLSDWDFVLAVGNFTTYQWDTVNRVVKINV